jgi:hypothetical protein
MITTLLLDQTRWDLVLDASGNIALASEPYSLAQNVACAVRTFLGECWYDTTQGVPYFTEILGHWPPDQLLRSRIEQAALTVAGVAKAQCTISSMSERKVTGVIQGVTSSGTPFSTSF